MTINGDFWTDYCAKGNTKSGDLAFLSGKNSIVAKGNANSIQIGENVRFKDVRIEMPNGGGRLIIGDNVQLRGLFQIGKGSTIIIGEGTFFNRVCHLSAWESASISVGNNCLLSNVQIRTSDMHSINDVFSGKRINPARDIIIGNKVWLGESVTIYKGVNIGDGSIIGGHSIVTKSMPCHVVAAGNPARIVRRNVTWNRELKPLAHMGAMPLPLSQNSLNEKTDIFTTSSSLSETFPSDRKVVAEQDENGNHRGVIIALENAISTSSAMTRLIRGVSKAVVWLTRGG